MFAFSNLWHQKRLTKFARRAVKAQLTADINDLCRREEHTKTCFVAAVFYRVKVLRRHRKWVEGVEREERWGERVEEGDGGDGGGKAGIPAFFVDKDWLDAEERWWHGGGKWWEVHSKWW
jgi:hypothetical protein